METALGNPEEPGGNPIKGARKLGFGWPREEGERDAVGVHTK